MLEILSKAAASLKSTKFAGVSILDIAIFDYCQIRIKKYKEMKKELSDASDSNKELKEEQKKIFKSYCKLWINYASQVDKNGPMNKKDFNP